MAPRQKTDRVTITTVAEDAGVSAAAVSKVLRDAYGVSAGMRAKVQASMLKLGYRPHAAARGMRGQTYTLGFLIPGLHNPFFADILAGMNDALERTQYQVLLGVSDSTRTMELALVENMIDRRMDGLIIIGPRMLEVEVRRIVEQIPVVMIAHHAPHELSFDTVNNDDQLGASLVVRHLVAAGHKRIAFVSHAIDDPNGIMVTTQREIGFRRAMQEAGLARYARTIMAPETPRDLQGAVRTLLGDRNRPDAVFAWTDFVALEVISVAREMGLSVPDDVAVVGYDNTIWCDLAQNGLTSIDQSGQALGLQAARLLIERIKGREKAEHFVVTPRLVVRGSSQRSPRP
jgi:DNA-binding LacI/PurR family transcriptional regulator